MAPATRGVPVGDPPGPGNACTLDELTGRLRDLRSWARLTLRDIPEHVEALRRQRGVRERHEVRPSYGAVQALFQSDRKRLDEGLLLDTVRVLLDCQNPSAVWREERVADWRKTYRVTMRQPVPETRNLEFRLGPLQTPCQILEGDGEHSIEERRCVFR